MCVVFDIGGVLVPTGDRMEQLQATVADVVGEFRAADFLDAYWKHRDLYDAGCADTEYWHPVLTAAGVDEGAITPEIIDTLATFDAESNTTISTEADQLIRYLHAHCVPTAVLSNAPRAMAQAARRNPWTRDFVALGFSSELGVSKPAPEAYEALLGLLHEQLGTSLSPENIQFFDDRPVNVEAARHSGWHAQVWSGADAARETLHRLGLVI